MFQEGNEELEISHVSLDRIRQFVHFLYFNEVEIRSDEEAAELYQLAERFEIPGLRELTEFRYMIEKYKNFGSYEDPQRVRPGSLTLSGKEPGEMLKEFMAKMEKIRQCVLDAKKVMRESEL
jgi:hypothetical protein